MKDTRNLLERLEHLRAALSEAQVEVDDLLLDDDKGQHVLARIDDADGIAFEIQTMIDGR